MISTIEAPVDHKNLDRAYTAAVEGVPAVLPSAEIYWARFKLAALVAAILAGVALLLTDDPTPPFVAPPGATNDLDVFGRIVVRVRGGESFYDATQSELRTHGYPTRSVFNWRTPFYAWLIGSFPSNPAGGVLVTLAALAFLGLACIDILHDVGFKRGTLGVILVAGSVAWAFRYPSNLFTEVWAGVAIALSACALRRGWTTLGVVTGWFALFFRELALAVRRGFAGARALERTKT